MYVDEGQKARKRSDDVRFIGALMGRYLLASRRQRPQGVQAFACRLQSITPQTIVVSAPVPGEPGEPLIMHMPPFGMLSGRVDRLIDGGFTMEIEADQDDRDALARRIAWQKKRIYQGVEDKRRHTRLMPRDPRTVLVMADGRVLECLIIDMSCSGAAVSADIRPEVGTPLAVGKVVGRVVRFLEVGFAVRFRQEVESDALDEMLDASIASV